MRLDRITADDVDALGLSGSASNANCALRTLRRMLHKAEEWRLIRNAPKIKLMKEYGRSLRLDDQAEKKLLSAAEKLVKTGEWTVEQKLLFSEITILVRDTGMRNERELYRIRIESIDWNNKGHLRAGQQGPGREENGPDERPSPVGPEGTLRISA